MKHHSIVFSEYLCKESNKEDIVIAGAVLCAAIINRLIRDDVTSDRKALAEWEEGPQRLAAAYIKLNS